MIPIIVNNNESQKRKVILPSFSSIGGIDILDDQKTQKKFIQAGILSFFEELNIIFNKFHKPD